MSRSVINDVCIMTARGRIIPEHKTNETVRTNRSARIVSVITLVFVSLLLSSLLFTGCSESIAATDTVAREGHRHRSEYNLR